MFACFDARSYELHLNACVSLASKRLLHYTVIHKLLADFQSRSFSLCLSEWPQNCRDCGQRSEPVLQNAEQSQKFPENFPLYGNNLDYHVDSINT